jgi:uncharacterized protein YutE (UPF0331/DUF86 family)
MIDPELVTRKTLLIAKDVEALQGLSDMTEEAFLGTSISAVLAERYIERSVGRMIDINFHLLTESGQAPPSDYYQSFVQLAELGVYPSEFAQRIAACAGLRNRIAHEYEDIDPRKLFQAVRRAVHDVPDYLRHVDAWLCR